jgi:exopolysaccharide biosynthesis protein
MNLDGGSSAALYYGGETIYGKVNESGEAVQRPVKSALLVQMIKK